MSSLTVSQANRILLSAVKNTDLQRFDYAVAHGADITVPNERGKPLPHENLVGIIALHEAIRQTQKKKLTADHIAIIERLLVMGVDIDAREAPLDSGSTPLHAAAISGHQELVDLFLARGAKLFSTEEGRGSLLRWTASEGLTQFMQLLLQNLENRLDDDLLRQDLESALCEAASHGHIAILTMLLEREVNANARGGIPDNTALMHAASSGHRDIVELLRRHGADIWTIGDRGTTTLHSAACGGLTELAQELLAGGSNPHATDFSGSTPLAMAAAQGHGDIARALVQHGSDLRAATDWGTVLTSAAFSGMNWLVEACLNAGEAIDIEDDWGTTPLMMAAQSGQLQTMQLLVERGANVNHVADYEGDTALHRAIYGKKPAAAQWLIEQGADLNTQTESVEGGTITPLMNAVSGNQLEIAAMLIAAGADVNATDTYKNRTALSSATESGNEEITKFLLHSGANATAYNNYGRTPLISAVIGGNAKIVALLIETGTSINACENGGETALHKAALGGNIEIIAMLLAAGADRNIVNKDGQTPLEIATLNDFTDVVEILKGE